jgi:signal peptidase I
MKKNKETPEAAAKTPAEPTAHWKGALRENLESLVFPLILVLITRTFIFQAFKIPSESMRETLLVGDHILVNKSVFFDPIPGLDFSIFPVREPERSDILVFKFPNDAGKDYIKRVVGLPGETLAIRRPDVSVGGSLLSEESYAIYLRNQSHYFSSRDGDYHVPPGQYFMMGDNRDNSEDSRFWGFLEKDLIKGKAFVIYFSWDTVEFDLLMSRGQRWKLPWYFLKTIRWGRTFNLLR